MKKNHIGAMKHCVLGLFIGLVLWGCNADTDPAPEMPYYDIDSYEYPDIEWGNYIGVLEKRDACQIPINTVRRMTTKALVQAILDYPMLSHLFGLYGHCHQRTFEMFFFGNNAFNELASRNDRGKELLERLIDDVPLSQDLATYIVKESQGLALEQLTSEVLVKDVKTLQSIVRTAIQRYELRLKNEPQTSYALTYKDITFVLISRAMLAANYAPYVREVNKNQYLKYYTEGWYPKDWDLNYPEDTYVDHAFEYRYHLAELDSYRQIIHAYGILF